VAIAGKNSTRHYDDWGVGRLALLPDAPDELGSVESSVEPELGHDDIDVRHELERFLAVSRLENRPSRLSQVLPAHLAGVGVRVHKEHDRCLDRRASRPEVPREARAHGAIVLRWSGTRNRGRTKSTIGRNPDLSYRT
jgi:hypothetical protein